MQSKEYLNYKKKLVQEKKFKLVNMCCDKICFVKIDENQQKFNFRKVSQFKHDNFLTMEIHYDNYDSLHQASNA